MNFDTAFALLLGHEGDFSDHAADPGGKTRFGITEAVARQAGYTGDMRELPVNLAKRIYLDSYWRPVRADDLPPGVRYIVFDGAVNSGPAQSALWLQRALGVTADGVIGPKTLAAAYAQDPVRLNNAILAQRLRFMTGLTNWPAFSRGWARRIADLMEA
ncbi:MAG: glycoside hydrolase family 108 protein [Betaproteobacteria bacterium]